MQRMFTRRTFVGMTAASLAARALPAQETASQSPAPHTQTSPQFSVMIWTLKKLGTFEENLDRVAMATRRIIHDGPGPAMNEFNRRE